MVKYKHEGQKGPWILLRKIQLPEAANYVVKARIFAPAPSASILFYNTREDKQFKIENSKRAYLEKGWNNVYFKISNIALAGSFRYDPGYADGTYKLESFEIKYLP
ncbi:MAG: hypothetical protein K9G67_12400 [Bacteroidales bacterium]|nr:hypothetical protein [Bacteroidales bacterium]MCF8350617.1 hypothetical protein [Bacteroidales bacterium]MCF8377150.1 hypothetical protein [Bacteroidales bacterium]